MSYAVKGVGWKGVLDDGIVRLYTLYNLILGSLPIKPFVR